MLNPQVQSIIKWPRDQQPMLVVIVDTEAEFDWSQSASRQALGVSSAREQWRAHRIYDRYRVRPTYVLDYPVASRPEGYRPVLELVQDGRAEIGAHLQPWDTPPLLEELSDYNSYPGNLPLTLERDKLRTVTEMVRQNLGLQPRVYKAGRYGVGPATAQLLSELGYEVDVSVLPGTDLSAQHGPDFSRCCADPYWFGPNGTLLEVPLCIGFTGVFAAIGVSLYKAIARPRLQKMHLPGLASRLRLLDRITLTPEGVTFLEQRRLTKALIRRGHRVFSLTYHSPSLAPGNTPYVRTNNDLDAFLGRIEQYVDFFMSEIGGRPATPLEVKHLAQMQAGRPSVASL
jgi:hypothetical protein